MVRTTTITAATTTRSTVVIASLADHEDRSVTSTVTVERTLPKHRVPQAIVPVTKTVRFHLEHNKEYEEKEALYIEDFALIWYQSTDFKAFRMAASADAKRIAAADQKNSYTNSFRPTMERIYDSCSDGDLNLICKGDRRVLCLMMKDLNRLGLERWCVKSIRLDRSLRKKEAVAVVLDIQDGDVDDCFPIDERMRTESLYVTSADALFSHVIAATLACS